MEKIEEVKLLKQLIKNLEQQNTLLKQELGLLQRNLCVCPKTGDWLLKGTSIFCPVHNQTYIQK